MAQKAEAKVQSAITALVDDVDKSFLRNKQASFYVYFAYIIFTGVSKLNKAPISSNTW